MATRAYEGKKFDGQWADRTVDHLTVEEALQININDQAFTVSMRTPGDDFALVRGLLHNEGIIKSKSFLPDVSIKQENEKGVVTIVNLNIPEQQLGDGYSNSRSLLSVSSCGICGKTELSDLTAEGDALKSDEKISLEQLHGLFDQMNQFQFDFHKSGGTHAAAAFNKQGELLIAMEDIGRHNAVDKVVGGLLLKQNLSAAQVLTVSGRISYEIVIKCFKAGIPILAAVSAPSSLAVDYAKELGITLFGFCRDQRATCYAHPQRTRMNTTIKDLGNKAG